MADRSEVVIAGERPDLLAAVRAHWLPDAVVAAGAPGRGPLWEGRSDGLAHLCRDFTCRLPIGEPVELGRRLDELAAGRAG